MDEKRPPRPPMQKEITCKDLGSGIYNFATPPVGFQQYLILGQEKALLIDSGMGIGSLKKEIEKVTKLPIVLINTHGHPDHCGGNAEFAPALMCPAEFDVYEKMATLEYRQKDSGPKPGGPGGPGGHPGEGPKGGRPMEEHGKRPELQPTGPAPVPVEDGAQIDLGGRVVEVLYTPGHTHGSICIFDKLTGSLFVGDNVMGERVSVYEWNSGTIEDLHRSLLRMKALEPSKLYSGHRPNVLEPEILEREIRCAAQLLDGAVGVPQKVRGGAVALAYEAEGVCICYDEKKIR
ncbi:MAG: MBL fold metallo-hydrolase [Oscillospiraceae bacterium]|nr:MBL fold metallo-hydrolase [Oscillospiraceae bacterium]